MNIYASCTSTKANTKIYITDVEDLKMEAKQLLNEVNNHTDINSSDIRRVNSRFAVETVFEQHSFNERLIDLKKRVHVFNINKNKQTLNK